MYTNAVNRIGIDNDYTLVYNIVIVNSSVNKHIFIKCDIHVINMFNDKHITFSNCVFIDCVFEKMSLDRTEFEDCTFVGQTIFLQNLNDFDKYKESKQMFNCTFASIPYAHTKLLTNRQMDLLEKEAIVFANRYNADKMFNYQKIIYSLNFPYDVSFNAAMSCEQMEELLKDSPFEITELYDDGDESVGIPMNTYAHIKLKE
jgi:hypothetical protein